MSSHHRFLGKPSINRKNSHPLGFINKPSINRKNSHPLESHYNKKEKKNFYNNNEENDDDFDDLSINDIEVPAELFPVDDKSMSIMETLEILSQYLWNGKFSSPVRKALQNGGASVIDIGCGPATWLMFMAEEFPKSSFVGIDIVIDLNDSKKDLPENMALISHDILDGLPFPDNTFDFVHQKHMTQSLTIDQWPFVIDELIRITKPGGWIEFVENECMPYSLGPVGKKYMSGFMKFYESCDIDGYIRESIERKLISADKIIEITDQARNFPLGGDGMAGELVRTTMVGSLESAGPYISTFIGVSLEEYDKMIQQCAVENLKYKPYIKNFRMCGKKDDTHIYFD